MLKPLKDTGIICNYIEMNTAKPKKTLNKKRMGAKLRIRNFNKRATNAGYDGIAVKKRSDGSYGYTLSYVHHLRRKHGNAPTLKPLGVYNPLSAMNSTRIRPMSYFYDQRKSTPTLKEKFINDLDEQVTSFGGIQQTMFSSYRKRVVRPLMAQLEAKEVEEVKIDLSRLNHDVRSILELIPADSNIGIKYTTPEGDVKVFTLNNHNRKEILNALHENQTTENEEKDSFGQIISSMLEYTHLTFFPWVKPPKPFLKALIISSDDDEPPPSPKKIKIKLKKKQLPKLNPKTYGKKKKLPPKAKKKINSSAFFPYTVDVTDALYEQAELENAGIFKEVKPSNYVLNCLTKALEQASISEQKYFKTEGFDSTSAVSKCSILSEAHVNKVHHASFGQDIPNRKLTTIANMIKRNITLDTDENKYKGLLTYPKGLPYKDFPTIKLISRHRHYFLDQKVPITSYAIENYDEVKDKVEWYRFFKKGRKVKDEDWEKRSRWLSKQQIIKCLWNVQKGFKVWDNTEMPLTKKLVFKPIPYDTAIMATPFYDHKAVNKSLLNNLSYLDADLRETHQQYTDKPDEQGEVSDAKSNFERLYEKHDKKDNFLNFYADFETFTREVSRHTPYLACAETVVNGQVLKASFHLKDYLGFCDNGTKRDIAWELLNWICDTACDNGKKPRIIFHNAKYDFRFIYNHIQRLNTIEPNGRFVCAWSSKGGGFFNNRCKKVKESGKYVLDENGRKINERTPITVKCSYNMIDVPLGKWGGLFPNITVEKDVMPYNVYTPDNYAKRWIPLDECLEALKVADVEQFKQNLVKLPKLYVDELVDIIGYAEYYCIKDCSVLRQGWETFRGQIKRLSLDLWKELDDNDVGDFRKNVEEYGKMPFIDTDRCNTSAKLAHTIMTLAGVYDNVYQSAGIIQAFMARCKCGGKTMLANNKPRLIVDTDIECPDANSLYPSAMVRLNGYLKGKPKVIDDNNLNYEWLKQQDGYFILIKLKKGVNLHPHSFPLQARKDGKTTVLNFTNDHTNHEMYLDNIALDDLLKYHKISADDIIIERGYYYDGGFNPTVKTVIKNLYATRKKYKSKGNPIEKSYKLILNSAYGYTILKPVDTEVVIKRVGIELDNHVMRYQDFMNSYSHTPDAEFARIEMRKPINDHFNYGVCGIQVLSMSKRIMLEVTSLTDDLGIESYYMDTDSLHFDATRIKDLEDKYNDTYKDEPWFKPLYGDDLGQFSSDFEIKPKGKFKDHNIRCRYAIYLGKKVYLEILEGKLTDEPWDNGQPITKYNHFRMKGCSEGSIEYASLQSGRSLWDIYSNLYKGIENDDLEGEAFDLLKYADGTSKPNFKFNSDYSIMNNDKFVRYITFNAKRREDRRKAMELKK